MSARGEQNSKLKESEVLEIYRLAWSGRYLLREIAAAFSISLSQVWMIKWRKEWKHLWHNEQKDNQPMSKIEIEASELDALKARVSELEKAGAPPASLPRQPMERFDPTARASMDRETMRDLATAIPPDLARDLHNDLARPNPVTGATPSQLLSDRGRVEVVQRGSGWAEPNPLRSPADTEHARMARSAREKGE